MVERAGLSRHSSENESSPRTVAASGVTPFLPGTRPLEASGQANAELPESARHMHDKKREDTDGNPSSGHKNPELPSPALSTPR